MYIYIYICIYRRRPRGVSPAPLPFLQGLGTWALAFVADEMFFGSFVRGSRRSWLTGASNYSTSQVVKQPPANQPTNQRTASKIRQDGSKIQPKSSKLGPKIHQVGAQNHPKSVPEALLDGCGRHVGPRWLQEPRRAPKSTENVPKMVPTWRPKSTKNQFKSDLKCD